MSVTSTTRVIEWGKERLRVGPWRGRDDIAYLSPLAGAALPSAAFVCRSVRSLSEQGYRRVVTGALSEPEQVAFRAAGFEVAEHLHLLGHDLHDLHELAAVRTPPGVLRRCTRSDRQAVLELDRLAFDPFWQLDEWGLQEAVSATSHTRFRIVAGASDPPVLGYAITGRAGRRGYVQRLAVHPQARRRGVGLLLVADSLGWLRRWRVDRAMVNTQLTNTAALALYERAGFERERSGLSVLARDLEG